MRIASEGCSTPVDNLEGNMVGTKTTFNFIFLCCISIICFFPENSGAQINGEDTTWMRLIEPEGLEGWIGREEFWSNDSGVIVGSGPLPTLWNTFLYYEAMEFGDFILQGEVMMEGGWGGNNNSGIQYRSILATNEPDAIEWYQMRGPQYELGVHWGGLQGEWIGAGWNSPNEICHEPEGHPGWQQIRIIADGDNSVHELNDIVCKEWNGFELGNTGMIGVQVHHSSSYTVFFKDLRITPLNNSFEIPEGKIWGEVPTVVSKNKSTLQKLRGVIRLKDFHNIDWQVLGTNISITNIKGRKFSYKDFSPQTENASTGVYFIQDRDRDSSSREISKFYLNR